MTKTRLKRFKKEIEQLLILGIVSRSVQNSFLKYLENNYIRFKYNSYGSFDGGDFIDSEPTDSFAEVHRLWELQK